MNKNCSNSHSSSTELPSTIAKCQPTSSKAASVIRKAISDKINKSAEQTYQPQQNTKATPTTPSTVSTATITLTEIKTEAMDECSKYESMDLKEINRQKELDEKYGG